MISSPILGLSGLVIDNTRTPAGQNLFQLFYSNWQARELEGDYMIKIEELQWRGRQTLLIVYYNDDEILRRPLPTRYDDLEYLADGLAGYLAHQVATQNQTERDLEKDDLKGSGIF